MPKAIAIVIRTNASFGIRSGLISDIKSAAIMHNTAAPMLNGKGRADAVNSVNKNVKPITAIGRTKPFRFIFTLLSHHQNR